jgi:hypothetical protein
MDISAFFDAQLILLLFSLSIRSEQFFCGDNSSATRHNSGKIPVMRAVFQAYQPDYFISL